MKPIAFKRVDDGELFTLNEDNKTYSLDWTKKKWPNNYHCNYTEDHLSNRESFEPIYATSLKDVLPDFEETCYVLNLVRREVIKHSIESKLDFMSGDISKNEHDWNLKHAEWVNTILIKLGGDSVEY